jgi:hypothetical protein
MSDPSYVVHGVFNELDAFRALRFTATSTPPAVKRTRIVLMTQYAVTFGMMGNSCLYLQITRGVEEVLIYLLKMLCRNS